MSVPPLVPPLKCQGIKTKLVARIGKLVHAQNYDRWIEPFCGSCVVPLNIQPKRALLSDSNIHLVRFYADIQSGKVTSANAKGFLKEEGERLRVGGEAYYYSVRDRFNKDPNSLDFLFLNRSCFNGMVRFNRSGYFNVPYCHKPERFAQSYITKIANQILRISQAIAVHDWTFSVADFRTTLAQAKAGDLVYADPPYAGRHVDYYNSWSERDEEELAKLLTCLPCSFVLSTWHSNEFRTNPSTARYRSEPKFEVLTHEHFYHVGSTENLRHPMTEALVTNFQSTTRQSGTSQSRQLALLE
jgi:DNA adenine methylase